MKTDKVVALAAAVALVMPGFVLAAMSSTNYFIYADTVDFGGGVGTSTSYNLQDSLGGYAVGISTSTNFQVRAGYQSAQVGILSLSLDGNSIDLGTLSTVGTVASGNINATVNTDSSSGYTMSVSSVSGTSLSAVTDGVVDGSGSTEEYGLAVSGTNSAFSGDTAISASLILSSSVAPVTSDVSVLAFKAVRATGSVAGTYSQAIIINAIANI